MKKILITLFGASIFLVFSIIFVSAQSFSLSSCVFTKELSLGMRDSEVFCLQRALNSDSDTIVALSGPGSYQNETDYFGFLTDSALRRYQNKISTELNLPLSSISLGVTDLQTRLALQSLVDFFKPKTTPTPAPVTSMVPVSSTETNASVSPKITSITPNSGKSGTVVTIKGSGFTPTGNRVFSAFESQNKYSNLSSPDGTTITITLTPSIYNQLKEKMKNLDSSGQSKVEDYLPKFLPMAISVSNIKGTSEPIFFNLQLRD